MGTIIDMDELTASEKILLVEDIWNDIASQHADEVEVSEAQKQDLEQRLAYLGQHPTARVSWETAKRRLCGLFH
jgi:putative addiction module component (TIGR02574 family)